ncbi:hypothetical protein QOZ80_3AG0219550 [Eleusine coracana subsp. coracana]|nr:hypothetical protein QOZ80_3AG0219530 [Eleusine coracana subsp. coracana]KAK3149591.1 hypothetical protein QOZ80_3AG0219550 [Eleusine coracana subsp. coracana]
MDMPLYQQLQLIPPSPKSSSFYYYPCSPPPFTADADATSFHYNNYHQLGSATPPPAVINSPPELSMEQPAPAPTIKLNAQGAAAAAGVASLDAASSASRKDRHSKICTAGGMRDRRMRLSLDVARKFFALQDMLGFDKASKTVQWLLNTSKAAIQEIMTDDALSECVEEDGSSSLSVVDGKPNPVEDLLGGGGDQQEKGNNNNGCGREGKKPAKARRATATPKPPRKSANAHPVLDKETRAKARERARERTKEKHRMRWVKLASAIDVEAAAAGASTTNNLSHSPSMNMAAAELEERCSSTLNNGGRTQEVLSVASELLAFGNGGYGAGSNYCPQEQWELGGVVFANARFY